MNTVEKELILKGLYRDRDELASKLNDVDKLIRKVKTNTFSLNSPEILVEENKQPKIAQSFPVNANLKVQVSSLI